MKILQILLFFILFSVNDSFSNNNIDSLLVVLDKEVSNSTSYFERRQASIMQLKQNLSAATFDSEKYLLYKQLYYSYLRFDSDSSEVYARRALELGKRQNKLEWQKESELLLIQLYSIKNIQPFASADLIRYGSIDSVLPPLQADFARITLENYIRMTRHLPIGEAYFAESQRLWKIYSPYLSEDAWYYTYYQYNLRSSDTLDIENRIREALSRTAPDSQERAILELTLSEQLSQKGNTDEAFSHLILSALCDIRLGNREAYSLLHITSILGAYPEHLNRTLKYLSLCEDNARLYKDYARSLDFIDAQHVIQQAYRKQLAFQHKMMQGGVVLLSILLIIIIYFFILLKRKKQKQDESYHQIEQMNELLEKQYADIKVMAGQLKDSNDKLVHEIHQRDKHFINAFYLSSTYIEDIKKFKRNIVQQLKSGLVKEAIRLASSSELSDEGLQSLYKKFDVAFLAIHPDFVERFNQLLKPEKRIILKEENCLTPELRIYAMVCLGIGDSTSIAEFLHYSPQTVYNYRLKIRKSACIDEKLFAETVRNLYVTAVS